MMIPRASAKKIDQTMDHLLEFPLFQQTCSMGELIVYNDTAKDCPQTMDWIGVVTRREEEVT